MAITHQRAIELRNQLLDTDVERGFDFETSLEVSTDGRRLIIEPVTDNPRRKKFEAAMEKSHKKFAKTFKKLAE